MQTYWYSWIMHSALYPHKFLHKFSQYLLKQAKVGSRGSEFFLHSGAIPIEFSLQVHSAIWFLIRHSEFRPQGEGLHLSIWPGFLIEISGKSCFGEIQNFFNFKFKCSLTNLTWKYKFYRTTIRFIVWTSLFILWPRTRKFRIVILKF